jgi:ADP-heptose:LPS heptosyltransferase
MQPGKFKLGQSAYLVKQADAVITHDTGLMHVAAAFKKKVISFGAAPYRNWACTPIYRAMDLKFWK